MISIEEIKEKKEEIEEELNKHKKIVNKFGGIEELEKYILYISKHLGDIPIDCIIPTLKSSYISKDKIREKIEELKDEMKSRSNGIITEHTISEIIYKENILQELLKED